MTFTSILMVSAWTALQYGLAKSRDTKREKDVREWYQFIMVLPTDYNRNGTACTSTQDKPALHIGDYDNACYLDSSWTAGRSIASFLNATAYYYNATEQKFAICTLTETPHITGKRANYYSPPPTSPDNARGCFCLGPGADDVKCHGMTDLSEVG